MITEIYSKNMEDTDFDPKALDVNDELGAYYQSIRNLFLAETGAVFGAEDMPVDLESYVYSLGVNNQQLREIIINKIQFYCPLHKRFSTTVDVKFARAEIRDICFIDVVVDGSRLTSFLIK